MFEKENEIWISKLGPEGSGKLADAMREGIRKSFINRILDHMLPPPDYQIDKNWIREFLDGRVQYTRLTPHLRIYADRFLTEALASAETQEEKRICENFGRLKR